MSRCISFQSHQKERSSQAVTLGTLFLQYSRYFRLPAPLPTNLHQKKVTAPKINGNRRNTLAPALAAMQPQMQIEKKKHRKAIYNIATSRRNSVLYMYKETALNFRSCRNAVRLHYSLSNIHLRSINSPNSYRTPFISSQLPASLLQTPPAFFPLRITRLFVEERGLYVCMYNVSSSPPHAPASNGSNLNFETNTAE